MSRQSYLLVTCVCTVITASLIFTTIGLAAPTEDNGKISDLYTHEDGAIAIKLDNGFPNALAAKHCPTNTSWAGTTSASNSLKAALITAKALRSSVKVTINGCVKLNTWMKLIDLYIQ